MWASETTFWEKDHQTSGHLEKRPPFGKTSIVSDLDRFHLDLQYQRPWRLWTRTPRRGVAGPGRRSTNRWQCLCARSSTRLSSPSHPFAAAAAAAAAVRKVKPCIAAPAAMRPCPRPARYLPAIACLLSARRHPHYLACASLGRVSLLVLADRAHACRLQLSLLCCVGHARRRSGAWGM